jgi:hypothetical protein
MARGNSPLKPKYIDTLTQATNWMTEVEISQTTFQRQVADEGELKILRSLYCDGKIAKRIRPGTTIVEYRSISSARTKKEIVKCVITEFYNGACKSLEEILGALNGCKGFSESKVTEFLRSLISDGELCEQYNDVRRVLEYCPC